MFGSFKGLKPLEHVVRLITKIGLVGYVEVTLLERLPFEVSVEDCLTKALAKKDGVLATRFEDVAFGSEDLVILLVIVFEELEGIGFGLELCFGTLGGVGILEDISVDVPLRWSNLRLKFFIILDFLCWNH